MDLGADDYIPKPYTNDIILNAVKSRLEKHKLVNTYVEEKIDNTKKDIVATIPNEFKTPLIILNSYSDKLIQVAESDDKTELLEIAEVIKSSSDKLTKIFNDLSFYFELFNFEHDIENSTANPNSIIKEVAEKMLSQKEKNYQLILDDIVHTLQINPLHFKKITEEIIENAINSSDDVNKIIIKTGTKNNKFEIEISNSGIDLDNTNSAKHDGSFKKFNRTMEKQNGEAFGLGIVKKIMTLYNYDFIVQNNNGYSKQLLYFNCIE